MNEKTNGDDPIHVYSESIEQVGIGHSMGLTKREHLAGLAMQGLSHMLSDTAFNYEDIAKDSVNMADALIDELNKKWR